MLWRPRTFQTSSEAASNDIQIQFLMALIVIFAFVVPTAAEKETMFAAAAEASFQKTGDKNGRMNRGYGEYLASKPAEVNLGRSHIRSDSPESTENSAVSEEYHIAARMHHARTPQETSKTIDPLHAVAPSIDQNALAGADMMMAQDFMSPKNRRETSCEDSPLPCRTHMETDGTATFFTLVLMNLPDQAPIRQRPLSAFSQECTRLTVAGALMTAKCRGAWED